MATSIILASLFVLSTTMMSGVLWWRWWSVWIWKFYRIFTRLFSTIGLGWCRYHDVIWLWKPCSFKRRIWMYLHTLSCLSRYFVGASAVTATDYVMNGLFFFSTHSAEIRFLASEDVFFDVIGCYCLFLDGTYRWLSLVKRTLTISWMLLYQYMVHQGVVYIGRVDFSIWVSLFSYRFVSFWFGFSVVVFVMLTVFGCRTRVLDSMIEPLHESIWTLVSIAKLTPYWHKIRPTIIGTSWNWWSSS